MPIVHLGKEIAMLGHVVINRVSREGSIFVPDAHLRLSVTVLEEEAVLSANETFPLEDSRRIISDNPEFAIRSQCDFAGEVEVPEGVIRLARYNQERSRRWNEEMHDAFECMTRDGVNTDLPLDTETNRKYYGHISHGYVYSDSLGLDRAARFEIYRMVQKWILDAGGLV